MALFILRRLGVMVLTALCMTLIVFALTNLPPNLEKLAKTQAGTRITDDEVHSWLERNGYSAPILRRYGEWLGVVPASVATDAAGNVVGGRCLRGVRSTSIERVPRYCGVLQGEWGYSTKFRVPVSDLVTERLARTGVLMFWAFATMVPLALIFGVLAGMREGSVTDRTLSTISIASTSTPEYVSGVVFVVVFASSAVGLKWFTGSAKSAVNGITFENFTLPVATIALYGMGYIARMTRASMAEVMTAQYIRTARLKGVKFRDIVLRHALRNALIAPFTIVMLQFPWLLTGVVIVEALFVYPGFGDALVQGAQNNDIDLLLAVSVVAVVVVLVTQLISDIGYALLNPRIRVS
ncbi:peptide/nickel transport system permease protein [Rhodovulum bhavnagarense]|uniref:Peptide/nickel transport system permease protein n=1 Tax=Rhodovulum bhavnagarense TaxID=992286 RepID=A0A4R2RW77_9RHOB|nr:ABC transporter permease [Rhodovulum bhavnagarense]TCP63385.1 peptide/nickel transport system permease protein [Rhodovulum bhavnagarense]